MDSKKISEYLDQIQWVYFVTDEKTVVTGYQCMVPFYEYRIPIEFKTSRYWVSIRALLQRGIAPDRLSTVASLLSSLNAQSRSVRFFLVEDCAVLQAEVPISRFHPGTFLEALKNVCRYASMTGLEVSVLATNPSVVELYKEIETVVVPRFNFTSLDDEDALADFDISVNRLAD